MTGRSKQPQPEQAPHARPESAGPQPVRPGNFPVRTCVGCKERAVKSSLLRLVAAGNDLVPDPQARRPGRGVYLHPSLACLDKARRRRAFSRAFRVARPLGTDPLVSYLSQDEAAAGDDSHEPKGVPGGEGGKQSNLYGKQVEKLMSAR